MNGGFRINVNGEVEEKVLYRGFVQVLHIRVSFKDSHHEVILINLVLINI